MNPLRISKKPLGASKILLVALAALAAAAPATVTASDTAAQNPPVLLVGGTFAQKPYMDSVSAWLRQRGLQVWTMQLSGALPGSAAITTSSAAIGKQVDAILAQTGASQVALAGHSQGALAVRDYVRYGGGLAKTAAAVSLGGPQYGDVTAYACIFFAGCYDMTFDSPFLKHLNAGDPTPPGTRWVHLYTTDGVWESKGLEGAEVLALQTKCPGRKLAHTDEWNDTAMRELIFDALTGQPLETSCPA
jgi:triacylglycerol lipase